MESQHGSSGTGSGHVESGSGSDNQPPLWDFVTKLEKKGETGGTWSYQCHYCGEIRSGSYSRVKAHLLQIKNLGVAVCKKVTREDRLEMARLEEEWERKTKNSGPRDVQLPVESGLNSSSSSKKRKPDIMNPISKSFDMSTRAQLDQLIARMYYTGGLPFNLARNPYYQKSYTFAANNNLSGYVPPGYTKLRTSLLYQEKAHVERLLEPVKATWPEKGLTLVSDGWSDPTRKPLINFMATCGKGPMFLKAVNCFGEVKDKHFIANLMKEVIQEVGHQNVVQIITENAANCKAAGEIIESQYPHIYWTPCVVHTLNLALKNICAEKTLIVMNRLTNCAAGSQRFMEMRYK